MKRRKQRILSRVEVSINREADYIIRKAQDLIDGETFIITMEDGRVRTILGYPTREVPVPLPPIVSRGEGFNMKSYNSKG